MVTLLLISGYTGEFPAEGEIEWSRAREREKRARVSGPPDSLHCFVFKCLDLANDSWSAYSRSLPFALVRGSIRYRPPHDISP